MAPIGGIGIELWTMQSGILFDNIVLAGSADVAAAIATSAFEPRAAAEKASKAQAAQKEGGVMAQLKFYAGAAFAWCLENAMLVGPRCAWACCHCSSSAASAARRRRRRTPRRSRR